MSSGVELRRKAGNRHMAGEDMGTSKGRGKEQKGAWKLMGSSKNPWGDVEGVVGKSDTQQLQRARTCLREAQSIISYDDAPSVESNLRVHTQSCYCLWRRGGRCYKPNLLQEKLVTV